MKICMKRCSKCDQEKPESEFHKHPQSKDGLRPDCKECHNLQLQAYYAKNREVRTAYGRQYFEENKDKIKPKTQEYYKKNKEYLIQQAADYYEKNHNKVKWGWIKRKHGIDIIGYDWLYFVQNGKCLICGKGIEYESKSRSPAIDHDHKTGAIRGLVHAKCNSVLGFAEDSIETLEGAIRYLKGELA